jgi:hypothetical protein
MAIHFSKFGSDRSLKVAIAAVEVAVALVYDRSRLDRRIEGHRWGLSRSSRGDLPFVSVDRMLNGYPVRQVW